MSLTSRHLLHPAAALLPLLMLFHGRPLSAADGQTDLLPATASTTTISTSGSYVLVDNVTYTDLTSACISITANNTVLDLNGHTINGSGGSDINGTAILIDANNVTIKNGTIRNFGNVGIRILSGGASNVLIEDVYLEDLRSGGIVANSTGTILTVRRCRGRATPTVSGNIVSGGSGLVVEDCVFEGGGVTLASGTLISAGGIGGSIIRNNRFTAFTASGALSLVSANNSSTIEGNHFYSITSGASPSNGLTITGVVSAGVIRDNVIRDYTGVTITLLFTRTGTISGNVLSNILASSGSLTAISGENIVCEGNSLREINSSTSSVLGITAFDRSQIRGNSISRLSSNGGACTAISIPASAGQAFTGTIIDGNAIGSISANSATATDAIAINCTGRTTVTNNTIRTVQSAAGAATGIQFGTGSGSAIGNEIYTINASTGGTGTSIGTGIRVAGTTCRIENNSICSITGPTSVSTTTGDGAIILTSAADSCTIVGNRLFLPYEHSIQFFTGANNNYHAANIIEDTAVQDNGTGNTAGTMPGANTIY